MKILLTTLEYPPFKGGVANYYKNIVLNCPNKDDIFVLDNRDKKLVNKFRWFPAIFNIKKLVKQKKISHIIIGNILPLGTAVWILSWFMNFEYTVVIHGTDIMYAQKFCRKKYLTKKILKKSKNIICNSSFVAGLVGEYYNNKFKNKIQIVNPGIDTRVTLNMEGITHIIKKYNLEGKFVLFSISRLIKRKGVDKIIELFPEIIKEIPNLVYVVAGTGLDEKELRDMVTNQENNIIFLGEISEEDKWTWLHICDIFILPGREEQGNIEGFGIVYLEANLMGKPVIAGDHGGVRDAVVQDENGLLVNPEDNNEIINAVLKLARDKDLRESIGKQGKKRVRDKFDSQKQAKKIFNIINNKI